MARQRMRVRFCTRKVPGRWSLHSFFDDCSHVQVQKKGMYTGFTNDHLKRKRKRQLLASKMVRVRHGLVFFFLFLSLSCPFSFLFLYYSFSFSFPFSFFFFFPFSFSFPISFPFLFLSFSFCFSFLFLVPFPFPFLSLSYSFLFFPFPSFTLPFPFPFPRLCESFGQGVLSQHLEKRSEEKKTTTCEKTIWKGSGFLQDPIKTHQIGSDPIWLMKRICTRISALHNYVFLGNIRQLGRNLETTHHWNKNWLSRCLLPNTDPSCDLGCDALRIGSQ